MPERYTPLAHIPPSDAWVSILGQRPPSPASFASFARAGLRSDPLAPLLLGLHDGNRSAELAWGRPVEHPTELPPGKLQAVCARRVCDVIDDQGHLRFSRFSWRGRVLEDFPSCLPSGLALSLLSRVARAQDEDRDTCRVAAERLVVGLQVSIEAGGVSTSGICGPRYHEYPGLPEISLVLNGWLSAVIGLLEATTLTAAVKPLAERSIREIARAMPEFARWYGHRYAADWSRLSAGPYPFIVCAQLAHLAYLFQEPAWLDLSRRWSRFIDWRDRWTVTADVTAARRALQAFAKTPS